MIIKFKPTYDFQSVEFEMNVSCDCDLDGAFELYKKCLDRLIKVAPEQSKKKEPLASDKQKETMKKFGISFTETTTAKEAQELIKKSIES